MTTGGRNDRGEGRNDMGGAIPPLSFWGAHDDDEATALGYAMGRRCGAAEHDIDVGAFVA